MYYLQLAFISTTYSLLSNSQFGFHPCSSRHHNKLANSQFGFHPCSSRLPQQAGINIWMRSRVLQLSFLIFQNLLIRFSTWVSSELLLELVSPTRCTPGLLTICLVAHSMLSLMATPHRSPKFPQVSRKVQF